MKPPSFVNKEQTDSIWTMNAKEEKAAFESSVDWTLARWQEFPDMHIYHYTPYETPALKRLMGRYATKQEEIDRMLRSGMFVDLRSVTRQAVRAGIEKYSLKELEIFHDFERQMPLREGSLHLRAMVQLLESDQAEDSARIEGCCEYV